MKHEIGEASVAKLRPLLEQQAQIAAVVQAYLEGIADGMDLPPGSRFDPAQMAFVSPEPADDEEGEA
jgi:hypothetical protein